MTAYRAPDNCSPPFTEEDLEDLWRSAEIPVGHRKAFSKAVERSVAEYAADKRKTSRKTRYDARVQIERLARGIADFERWCQERDQGGAC